MEENIRKQIIEIASQGAAEILLEAFLFCDLENHITTIYEWRNGDRYELTFKKIKINL